MVLTLRGMLEAAVHDGPKDLRFQEEIAESGTVNRHVGSLDIFFGCLLVLNRSGLGLLLILVVQKIVIIGHFCVLFSFYLGLGYKDEFEGCGGKRVGFCKLHVFVNENAAFFLRNRCRRTLRHLVFSPHRITCISKYNEIPIASVRSFNCSGISQVKPTFCARFSL